MSGASHLVKMARKCIAVMARSYGTWAPPTPQLEHATPTRFLSPSKRPNAPLSRQTFYCGAVCQHFAKSTIIPLSPMPTRRVIPRSERRLPRLPWAGRSLKQCSCRNRLRAAGCTPDVLRQHVMRAESPVALSIWPRAQLPVPRAPRTAALAAVRSSVDRHLRPRQRHMGRHRRGSRPPLLVLERVCV